MLVNALLETETRVPGKVAVDDAVVSLTYRRLTRLALVLKEVVERETSCERVGVLLPASAMFPATLFGILWASRVAVPLNFLLGADALARIVQDAGLDLIVTVEHFRELSSRLPARAVFLEELHLKRRVALAVVRRLPSPPPVDRDDTAVILYTSGTTAEPKGVELTQNNLHGNASDSIQALQVDSDQAMLNILPPFHVFGLTCNVLLPILLGVTVYAIPRFSPASVVRTVARRGVSLMMAIPTMYAAMLRSKSAKPDTFRSVRLAVSGGEPLPEGVRVGFEERFAVPLHQGYGLTETSPVVAVCTPRAHRVGTVGLPIPGVELRVVTPDRQLLPAGQEGEILVRGPGVMKGYYRKPQETKNVIDPDGWFHTGDIGRLDADGYLSITGRAKEMLIIGGENGAPREIEAALEQHDAVLQAAVIGVPDELRGEVPVAFVMPHPGGRISEEALKQHAKKSLAGFKVPRRIVIRDELPKGPTGKILKRGLHELL